MNYHAGHLSKIAHSHKLHCHEPSSCSITETSTCLDSDKVRGQLTLSSAFVVWHCVQQGLAVLIRSVLIRLLIFLLFSVLSLTLEEKILDREIPCRKKGRPKKKDAKKKDKEGKPVKAKKRKKIVPVSLVGLSVRILLFRGRP